MKSIAQAMLVYAMMVFKFQKKTYAKELQVLFHSTGG
jgi:hypothetical protein